jgi:acyl-CoA thioester hydrolase
VRVKLKAFSNYPFDTPITIRVSDINYGNHLSNEHFLSYAHQARVSFFAALGGSELDFFGAGIIMADAAIQFKAEGHLGDVLELGVVVDNIHNLGFDLYYRLKRTSDGVVLGTVKTGIICFDYNARKITKLPEAARTILETYTAQ